MEKSTPHYKLSIVKTMIEAGKIRLTMSALAGATSMGFDFQEIIEILMSLTMADFYKSMTTHADHRIRANALKRYLLIGLKLF